MTISVKHNLTTFVKHNLTIFIKHNLTIIVKHWLTIFVDSLTFITLLFIIFVLFFPFKNYVFTMLLSLLISTLLICVSLSYVGAIYQVTPEKILSLQGYSGIVFPIYTFISVICVVMLYHLIHCIVYTCNCVFQILKKNLYKV